MLSSVPLSTCGNLKCDVEQDETTDNCAMDWQCHLSDACDDWESSNLCPLDWHYVNLICDRELGENSNDCPSDCTKGCDEMEMDGDGVTIEEMNMNYYMDNIDVSNKNYMDVTMNSMDNSINSMTL